MNKVITDGLNLMPPEFAGGLDVWSSEDGTPGSATYDGDPNAAFVPATVHSRYEGRIRQALKLTFSNDTGAMLSVLLALSCRNFVRRRLLIEGRSSPNYKSN